MRVIWGLYKGNIGVIQGAKLCTPVQLGPVGEALESISNPELGCLGKLAFEVGGIQKGSSCPFCCS